jgi:hypothetical protein
MTMTRLLGWARCSGIAFGLAVGFAACGDSAPPDEPAESVAALLCGSINLGQPDAQTECAEGPTTPGIPPNQWATLNAQLCNVNGIPAAGLSGATCTDPESVSVSVTELGNQRFTTALVAGSLTDPNTESPFAACQNTGAGNISVTPTSGNTNPFGNAGPFVVTQETADFVFGSDVQLPNQCAIAITDGHDQQILVNVGFQIGVDCANSACSSAAVIRRRASSSRGAE